MAVLSALAVIALIGSAQSWQVNTYSNVENCEPDSDTIYRFWSGGTESLGVCQGIAGAPTDATITCAEYTEGGVQGPTDCGDRGEHNYYGVGVYTDDTTENIDNVFCQFYARAGCDNWDDSPNNECFAPYGLGAVSFKCVVNE